MSDKTNSHLGSGDVSIILDGEEYFLKPTLNAAMSLSRGNGGIRGAIEGVMRMDLDIIVRVISLGLGQQITRKWKNDIGEVIWRSGLTDDTGGITAKCVEYLHVLANGGKPINKEAQEDTENPPQQLTS